MNGKRTQRSADIVTAEASAKAVPVRDSKPKRGLENPRSFPGARQSAEGDSGETGGMGGWQKSTLGKVATGFLSGGTPTALQDLFRTLLHELMIPKPRVANLHFT